MLDSAQAQAAIGATHRTKVAVRSMSWYRWTTLVSPWRGCRMMFTPLLSVLQLFRLNLR